ncbi:MAG: hypothetical protein U0Q03_17275 [Acidimicrobiales bacterium]
MTTSTPTPTDRPPVEPPARTRGAMAVRIGLTVIVLLLVAMWVYAFGFAEKKGVYVLDDDSWGQRAQDICERYEAQRRALVDTDGGYIENPTDEQMIERADIVDQATDLLEAELTEMIAVMPTSERDRQLVTEYEGYFRTMLADRRAYTARLRAFELGPYLETKVDGGPVTNVLLDFANGNRMPACRPPGELGGDTYI